MKLKLVVAMSVLGLVTSAFADTDMTTTTTTTTKHKVHHKVKHHRMVSHRMVSHRDYKDTGAIIPMVTECQTDWYQPTMDAMDQNTGRARPTVDCNKPLTFAGGINFDYHFGNLSTGYTTENTDKFTVNDAYINAFGNVNSWSKAFVSLSYNNASHQSISTGGTTSNGSTNGVRYHHLPGQYSFAYSTPNTLNVEQAFITIGDMHQYPVFLQVGKQFADYGRYEIHALTRTLVQSMTESLRTSVDVGFVTQMGLHGSVYGYDNGLRKSTSTGTTLAPAGDSHSNNIYGISVGFDQPSDQLGYGLGIGYVSNMVGANDVQGAVSGYKNSHPAISTGPNTYVNTVGAIALYGDLNSGPFDLGIRYTTALQAFNALDLPTSAVTPAAAGGSGAKLWAADITAGYGFNMWAHDQKVYIGYQQSGNASTMDLPSNRWLVGYGYTVMKNTGIGFEFDHDTAYNVSKGGLGNNSNIVGIRVSTMFG